MNKRWSVLKSLINGCELKEDLFLSLITEDGVILSANANMQKTLHIKNPKEETVNFFSLLHPEHITAFKTAIDESRIHNSPSSAELYLKNGYYHPMKWQINYIENPGIGKGDFLCVGYKLLDDERLKQFNILGEQNYQTIVEGLNAGILFQDSKGELIAANKKAAEIFGATLERLYQLTDIRGHWNESWEVYTENGKPVDFDDTPYMKALATGKAVAEILCIKLRNGQMQHILFNSQPLFNAGESIPFSVVSNIVDVTREKQLSGEMQERDMPFRSFLDKTPNLSWVVDESATLLFASTSFYQYFGLKEENCIDKNILELIPSTVGEALHDKHLQVLETGTPLETIEKMKWSDGTNFVFHINLFPIQGVANKKMVGGHAVNMAEKFATEKKLREANERLLLLSRATTDAIWEWDMQTGYIFRNDALMDMVGYNAEDSKGLSWWLRRIHPEDRNRLSDIIKEATDKGQHSWEDQYRFKCADGTYKHVQDKGYVVYENGLPVKMIGSLQDITELKELEGQLVEEKLQRQKEISETVIKVQEKERTRIGHELHDNVNQILSTAKLFMDMVTPSSADEKTFKAKGIEYLLSAIEEIRKLSRELVVPQLKEKGLTDSVKLLIEDINISSPLKIRFTHDQENEMLSSGKKITLFRIIQEQLKNILKYSKAKQVEIYLQYKDDHVQLTIKDDGVGFDPRQTHKGIGLSNIHDRTRFYNGTVDIQAAPGKGCILTISIPGKE